MGIFGVAPCRNPPSLYARSRSAERTFGLNAILK